MGNIYYVSQQNGKDTNDGLSPSTPWLTVTKAVQTLIAGDTCYVGAGTYRERPTNVNAGTDGNLISFIGDPDSQYVIGDKPGIVRVTGCGVDEIPTAGTVWDRQKDYVLLKNFVVDGCSGTYAYAINNGSGITANRFNVNIVTISGYTGMYYGTSTNCLSLGSFYGFFRGITTNCVGLAGNTCFNICTSTNCLALGSGTGFDGGTNTNCMSIAGNYGYNFPVQNTNCVSFGGNVGFNGGPNKNCLSVCGYKGFNNGLLTNCKVNMCVTPSAGTTGDIVTNTSVTLFTLFNMQKMIETFEPWMFEGVKQWGDTSVNAGTSDILGRTRRMLTGGIDIGPYAFSDVKPDFINYQSTSPGITFNTAGQKIFEVPAKANTPITVSVQSKWTGATLLPQIILTGDSIIAQTATNTAPSDTWQELSVTATPTKDEILKLFLTAQDTTVGATATFSDITVS